MPWKIMRSTLLLALVALLLVLQFAAWSDMNKVVKRMPMSYSWLFYIVRPRVQAIGGGTTEMQLGENSLEGLVATTNVSHVNETSRSNNVKGIKLERSIVVFNNTSNFYSASREKGKANWFPGAKTLSLTLTPLRPMDREFYTIRMNTWQRHQQLIASIKHHSRCEGVAQIQVIWQESGDPPKEVVENPKVVIEKHTENKLNQRFNILIPTPTLGILSVDDDVLYPCEAVDVAFHAWTKNPERQVGFDRRNHSVRKDGRWKV